MNSTVRLGKLWCRIVIIKLSLKKRKKVNELRRGEDARSDSEEKSRGVVVDVVPYVGLVARLVQ